MNLPLLGIGRMLRPCLLHPLELRWQIGAEERPRHSNRQMPAGGVFDLGARFKVADGAELPLIVAGSLRLDP